MLTIRVYTIDPETREEREIKPTTEVQPTGNFRDLLSMVWPSCVCPRCVRRRAEWAAEAAR